MQNLETFTAKVQHLVTVKQALNSTVKFKFKEGGFVWLDGTNNSNGVMNEDKEADCTITMHLADAFAFLDGKFDILTAYMLGKMKVSGDFSVAMKVVQVMKG